MQLMLPLHASCKALKSHLILSTNRKRGIIWTYERRRNRLQPLMQLPSGNLSSGLLKASAQKVDSATFCLGLAVTLTLRSIMVEG